MRTTLLGSLLDVAARNLARDAEAVALFESGQVYLTSRRWAEVDPTSTDRPIDPLAGVFAGERAAPFAEPHRIGGARGRAAVREVLAWRR